ncbi:hypothetical protein KC19_12G072900 [Ceratodon purpureus]|uniref:Transmembrane protein n=1 Tax=Ceratodon purpureus TaxID=3225 RepID=A0A8T0G859_CERPU|nr:hypothetical protein KC19_12G072900 [Ceratodon purpureus]
MAGFGLCSIVLRRSLGGLFFTFRVLRYVQVALLTCADGFNDSQGLGSLLVFVFLMGLLFPGFGCVVFLVDWVLDLRSLECIGLLRGFFLMVFGGFGGVDVTWWLIFGRRVG